MPFLRTCYRLAGGPDEPRCHVLAIDDAATRQLAIVHMGWDTAEGDPPEIPLGTRIVQAIAPEPLGSGVFYASEQDFLATYGVS